MPEVDGITLNKWIKENHRTIKTLVVSMHNTPEIIDDLIESNVDATFKKTHKRKNF
ncbi:hypothetical protein JCM19274_2507 [Algibacter lectus]|nr:hypothetical protein JCM19274_2507 [Algibacter lectus]